MGMTTVLNVSGVNATKPLFLTHCARERVLVLGIWVLYNKAIMIP
jgi:hypothetical protein